MSSKNRIRWIDLSEEEKREVLRIPNAESARKSREKKKLKRELGDIEEQYKSNEERIKGLEQCVTDLSGNLKPNPSRQEKKLGSSTASSSSKRQECKSNPSNIQKQSKDERPDWFGEPF